MDFKAIFEQYRLRVESGIEGHLPPANTRPERLHQAMRYSLEAGGKRLRPILCLAASDLFPTSKDAIPAAVAIECLHTYSLIHDDLPCMDDGELRRGRPTCHRQFDEATAVLAGDALLTHAFGLIAESYAATPALAAGLVADLATAAGSRALIAGQAEDMEGENSACTPDQLDFIHLNKTAALIAASLKMGGRIGGGTPQELQRLEEAGRRVGLAFQIVDDILDATSDTAALGKTAGNDARNGKRTYPRLHGLEASRECARGHTSTALRICENLPADPSFLVALIQQLEHRIA
jgi:geranylgeranyl diphosphate synthase, type II